MNRVRKHLQSNPRHPISVDSRDAVIRNCLDHMTVEITGYRGI